MGNDPVSPAATKKFLLLTNGSEAGHRRASQRRRTWGRSASGGPGAQADDAMLNPVQGYSMPTEESPANP
ncbi:MAG: hypothetical protein EB084_18000 [Proteobacteria bacterium]|nr:hypothetical protein [Pseudomonadota bacterium]